MIQACAEHAVASSFVTDVWSGAVKFGLLLRHASKLHQKYVNICASNAVSEYDAKRQTDGGVSAELLLLSWKCAAHLWSLLKVPTKTTKRNQAIKILPYKKRDYFCESSLDEGCRVTALDVQTKPERGRVLLPDVNRLVECNATASHRQAADYKRGPS